MSSTNPQNHITAHLLANNSLPVSPAWLSNFLSSQRSSIPLTALTQTALFRILASDFKESLSTSKPSVLLPVDISDPAVKERRIPGPVPVQVLDIDDIGTSLWSQIEAIERVERGEAVRGREIVRTVNVGDDDNSNVAEGNGSGNGASSSNNTGNTGHPDPGLGETSSGPHRLMLQDAAGTRVVAIELKPVEGVAIGKLPIGAKMVLRNTTVARGIVLLSPECATLLGGKIEAMDKAWREGRKARLLARVEQMERERAQRDEDDDDVIMEE
ncbi:hypothetical protein VTN00DRAFT_7119 [Thermoascus crustaceus]|uniref:uncharacterized protein n=1 Tax=Thermoascus crustaceus TaxID=5088 RepID=UPI003741F17D